MKLVQIFAFLILWFSWPSTAGTSCLDYSQRYSHSCKSFSYDTLLTYFEDEAGVEHVAIVNRVRDSFRKVVHADYHFASANNQPLAEAVWAWRTAWREGRVYVYTDVCDPTLEACCDNLNNCNSPYSTAPNIQRDATLSSPSKPSKRKDKLDWIEQGVGLVKDSLIIGDYARNGYEMQDQLIEQNSQPTKYFYRDTGHGYYKMMQCVQNVCTDFEGQISWDGKFGMVELHNIADFAIVEDIRTVIPSFMESTLNTHHTGIFCTESNAKCDPDGKRCTVTMTCHRR